MSEKRLVYYIELFIDPFFNAEHDISLTYEHAVNLSVSTLLTTRIHFNIAWRRILESLRSHKYDCPDFQTTGFLKKNYTFSLLDLKRLYITILNHDTPASKFINHIFENKETSVYKNISSFARGKEYVQQSNDLEQNLSPIQLRLPNNKNRISSLIEKSIMNYQHPRCCTFLYYENNKWNHITNKLQ